MSDKTKPAACCICGMEKERIRQVEILGSYDPMCFTCLMWATIHLVRLGRRAVMLTNKEMMKRASLN